MITADKARDLMPYSRISIEQEIEKKIIEAAKNNFNFTTYTIMGTLEYCLNIVEDLKANGYLVQTLHERYEDFDDVKHCRLTIKW